MAETSAGSVSMELELGGQSISAQIGKAANEAINGPLKDFSNSVKSSFDEISAESKKSINVSEGVSGLSSQVKAETDRIYSNIAENNAKIKAILDDTTKTAKGKAMSIAHVYKSEGLDMSEAMKKAWTTIERDSKAAGNNVSKDADKTGKNVEGSVKKMAKNSSNSIKSMASSATSSFGAMAKNLLSKLAVVFGIRQIVRFGKECLKLGSDLTEVQNVVDVTFGDMADSVNSFAKSAIKDFGLSETLAKRYMGTMGAMAKSFGFSTEEALNMSQTLTGLVGDVASFYNLDPSAAYTKIKAVFTGETESLKELGVVMTQNALDQYALQNSYGKTTAKMTEQEKVALRYAFIQDKLAAATGDFVRTQDSWANQTRVLSLQFESFKAAIGQGLINVLTPVIKVINILLGKLVQLAETFSAFTSKIFGKQQLGGATVPIEDMSSMMSNLGDSTAGVGDSASKAAKQIKRSVMGFDQLNTLADNSDSAASAAGLAGAAAAFSIPEMSTSNVEKEVEALDGKMASLVATAKKLGEEFNKGFKTTFDGSGIDSIRENIHGLLGDFNDIFNDEGVQSSASTFMSSIASTLGKGVGAIADVGVSIVDNLTGGIALAVDNHKDQIQNHIVTMFDIGTRISEAVGLLFESFSTIFSVLRGKVATELTGHLIGIWMTVKMTTQELFGKFAADLVELISKPISDNAEDIKKTIEGILEPFNEFAGTVDESLQRISDKFNEVYDTHLKPFFDDLKEDLSDILGKILEGWNTYIKPVLDKISEDASKMWVTYVEPIFTKAGELLGSLFDLLGVLWKKWLKPLVDWIVQNIFPIVSNVLAQVWNVIKTVFSLIGSKIKEIIGVVKGIIDFLVGVFTGDWDRAWNAIKSIFESIVNGIKERLNVFINFFKESWENFKKHLKAIGDTISSYFELVITWLKNFFGEIVKKIGETATNIKTKVTEFFTNMKNSIKEKFDNIKTAISEKVQNIKDSIVNKFNDAKTAVYNIFENIKTKVSNVFQTLRDAIKSPINGIITMINRIITGLNKIHIDIPDWVPGLGGKTFGFNISQVPLLANGGYVEANTPRLAIIGDNKREGEIVAPESKIREGVGAAIAPLALSIQQLVSTIANNKQYGDGGDIVIPIYLDGGLLDTVIINAQSKNALRTGGR